MVGTLCSCLLEGGSGEVVEGLDAHVRQKRVQGIKWGGDSMPFKGDEVMEQQRKVTQRGTPESGTGVIVLALGKSHSHSHWEKVT